MCGGIAARFCMHIAAGDNDICAVSILTDTYTGTIALALSINSASGDGDFASASFS